MAKCVVNTASSQLYVWLLHIKHLYIKMCSIIKDVGSY